MTITFPEMDGEAENMKLDPDLALEVDAKAGPAILSKHEAVPDKPEVVKAEELSVAQLRFLLEQKLLAEAAANEESKTFSKPPYPAPQGMLWVFNRGPKPFEWQYDGICYEVDGHSAMPFMERVARHGRKRSLLSLDPIMNTAVFQLSLYEVEILMKDKKKVGEKIKDNKYGVPLKVVRRTELIDRSHVISVLGDGSPIRTTPRLIQVDGVAEMMSRRPDSYVELE
jgi:hypothetical protein